MVSPLADPHLTTMEQVHTDVDNFLETFFKQQIKQAEAMDENYGVLWQAIRDVTLSGGKRLRPYLLVLCYQAYGGRAYKDVLAVAAALELLHVSLLIHDDIIDKDYVRHGQLNVAGIFKKHYKKFPLSRDVEHYANGAALLGGDSLLFAAYDLVMISKLNSTNKQAVLHELNRTVFTVIGGQLLDMESALQPFSMPDTLHIAELKTAYYSFTAPIKIGALLAGAPTSEVTHLHAFGTSLGVAYQLVDDLLGIYGDEASTGKSSLSDISEGKRTFMMTHASNNATKAERKILDANLGKADLTQAQAESVRKVLVSLGAKRAAATKINACAKEAQNSLEHLHIKPKAKIAFEQLIKRAIKRTN